MGPDTRQKSIDVMLHEIIESQTQGLRLKKRMKIGWQLFIVWWIYPFYVDAVGDEIRTIDQYRDDRFLGV